MYIKDLAQYVFDDFPVPGVKAVGWLSGNYSYPKGPLAPSTIAKLRTLTLTRSVNQTRGFHQCPFCSSREPKVKEGKLTRCLGSAEIWLPRVAGGYFAAPDLLLHYVENHAYMPPAELVESLEALDIDNWQISKSIGLDLHPSYRRTTPTE